MSSIVNPVFAYGMVPGSNPTGNPMSFSSGTPATSTGAKNPLLPNTSPSTTSSGTGPGDLVPSFPANAGPYGSSLNLGAPGTTGGGGSNVSQAANSPFSFLNTMTSKDIGRLFSDLKKTYGDGTAHLILDFLTSGAGFDQKAINNLLASLQPGIERGEENIMEQFSAMGNRFGSPAATGLGDYLSQVNLNEGQLVTQMYEQALENFMNVMMGTSAQTSKRLSSSPSIFDSILKGIGLGGSAAGGASSIISALAPNADTTVLDTIASAAGAF